MWTPVGVAALAVIGLRSKRSRVSVVARVWVVAWSPLLLLGAVHFALLGGSPWLMLQASLGLAAGLLVRAEMRSVAIGLLIGLACLSLAFVVEKRVSEATWAASGEPALSPGRMLAALGRETLSADAELTTFERGWAGAIGSGAWLELDVRLVDGQPGWFWFRNDPTIELVDVATLNERFTSVTPSRPSSARISRRVETGAPLAGRTFRVDMTIRTSEAYATTASECRGVVIRELGGEGTAGCFPQTYGTEFRDVSFEWTAPTHASSSVVSLELRLPVGRYDVGGVALLERDGTGWKEVGPLEPVGLRVAAVDPSIPAVDWAGESYVPTSEWQRLVVPLDGWTSGGGLSRAQLRLEPGIRVQTRAVALWSHSGERLPPSAMPVRGSAWFVHPNAAGHAVAVIALAAAALAPTPAQAVASLLLGMTGVTSTGSRTALFGLLIGSALLIVTGLRRSRLPPPTVRLAAMFAVVALFLAWFAAAGLQRVVGPGALDGNSLPRTEIWAFALESVLAEPVTGLAVRSFAGAWVDAGRPPSATGEVPTHAHNIVLHMAAQFGVPGLIGTLWLCCAMSWIAWRWGGMRGLALLFSVLSMQATDFTFFNAPVLLVTILALNALAEDRPAVSRADSEAVTVGVSQ